MAEGLDFTTETERTSANAASDNICAFIEALIPPTSSGSGLMSVLVRMRDERSISHEDLVANIAFLLFAGQETIVDMIGNAVMALHENPEQAVLVRSSADLIQAADELLRYEGSVQFTGARIAARDLKFGDVTVPAGVVGVIGSGSRDAEAYEGPNLLDVTRATQVPSLAFGWGPHLCIGRNVARMELKIALDILYRRLPKLELDGGRTRRRDAIIWRGLATAPIRLV